MSPRDLPARLAARLFDQRRGIPIPYVSEQGDGRIDFAVVNGARVLDCIRRQLCSLCGRRHDERLAFIGGPGGFLMRRYTDPPMHVECAEWSLRLCPYLARHSHRRRGLSAQTAAPGFTEMEKSQPVILAITSRCHVEFAYDGPDQVPGVVFIPAPWLSARRFDYRDGALVEGDLDLINPASVEDPS